MLQVSHSENFKSFTWKNVLTAPGGCWLSKRYVIDIEKVLRVTCKTEGESVSLDHS